jgi:hypothetical protein
MELTIIQNIQTVITSLTSQITDIDRIRNGTRPSKIIIVPTPRCESTIETKTEDAKSSSLETAIQGDKLVNHHRT